MTFLDPVPALVAGAVAVPALIALYFLKLRRKPLKVSSTLLWEQAFSDLQANVPLRWLRVSWPLVLQLAALVCLLLAFARPTVSGGAGAARRVVIVIDRSASMSAGDGRPAAAGEPARTRLDEAKGAALSLIDELRRGGGGAGRPAAMVVELGASPRVVCGFTDDAATLRDAVRLVLPSDQPAELGALVPLLRGALVVDAEVPALGTAVMLYTDGGLDTASASASLPRSMRMQPVRVGPVVAATPGGAGVDNLGVVAFSARRDAAVPSTVRVFARVLNTGAETREVALVVRVDGSVVGTIPLAVPASTPSVPGEASGTLELSLSPSAAAQPLLTLSIPRDDLLAADNTVGVVLPPVERPRVLVVGPGVESGPGGDGRGDDPSRRLRGEHGADRFLLGVLGEMELARLRVVPLAEYESERAQPDGRFGYDLVIFDRCRPLALPPVPSVSIGAGLPVPGLSVEPLGGAERAGAATRFISWKRTHPALRYAALDAVLVAPPMRLTIAVPELREAAPPPAASSSRPTITPLAFGASGPLIAEVAEAAPGSPRRLVLAMDLLQTNWGPDVSFPVFIASTVEYLTGRGDAALGRSGTTHEPVTLRAAPGVTAITVRGPVAASTTLQVAESASTATLGVPERVGVYTFEGTVAADATLPVNLLSAAESGLASGFAAASAVTGTDPAVPASAAASSAGPPARGTAVDADAPRREVWPWFVLAAVVLLTLEWFVYAWKMRL